MAGLPGAWEVVVADGGSTDGTPALAAAHPLAPLVVAAPRGRGPQQDAGARAATGDVLVFLHADSRLPRGAHAALAAALADPRVVGGNFALRFDGDDRFSRVLTAVYAVQRSFGIWYGDSTIWVRSEVFAVLGGFPRVPIMEDYLLARALRATGGRTPRLRPDGAPAVTSSRRWRRLGVRRTVTSWVVIRYGFLAGVPPERLATLYRKVR